MKSTALLALLLTSLAAPTVAAEPVPPDRVEAQALPAWGFVEVSWLYDPGPAPPERFEIFRGAPGARDQLYGIVAGTESRFVDSAAGTALPRSYRVRACDGSLCSSFGDGAIAQGMLGPPPAPPAPQSPPRNVITGRIQLSWAPTGRTEFYRVFRSDVPAPTKQPLAEVRSSRFADLEALTGKPYFYQLQSCNAQGCGPLSQQTGPLIQVIGPDADVDAVQDTADNCPTVPNGPDEATVYGVGDQDDGGDLDAYGLACECGDVSDDGVFFLEDVPAFRDALADPNGAPLPPGGEDLCNARGIDTPCDILDVVVLARAEAFPPTAIRTRIERACELGACEHSLCDLAAGPLTDTFCGTCVAAVCRINPWCCSDTWDAGCLAQALEFAEQGVVCVDEVADCELPSACEDFDPCQTSVSAAPVGCYGCVDAICGTPGNELCCIDEGVASQGWDSVCVNATQDDSYGACSGLCP